MYWIVIRRRGFIPLLMGLLMLGCGSSDTPLPPPTDKIVWSPNKRFYAMMDAKKWITTVYRFYPTGRSERIWAMYGWFRVASLGDDGNHIIAGYDGGNLLPLSYDQDQVMLLFFKRGELINYVTLKELIINFSNLKRTVSHYEWGRYAGLDQRGHYIVQTIEGRTIAFDIKTGKPIRYSSTDWYHFTWLGGCLIFTTIAVVIWFLLLDKRRL